MLYNTILLFVDLYKYEHVMTGSVTNALGLRNFVTSSKMLTLCDQSSVPLKVGGFVLITVFCVIRELSVHQGLACIPVSILVRLYLEQIR